MLCDRTLSSLWSISTSMMISLNMIRLKRVFHDPTKIKWKHIKNLFTCFFFFN